MIHTNFSSLIAYFVQKNKVDFTENLTLKFTQIQTSLPSGCFGQMIHWRLCLPAKTLLT